MSESSKLSRVVIVDDDPVTLRFFGGALNAIAHCVTAETGAVALAISANDTFDLFLIDLNLPDVRGEQLLKTLRVQHVSTRAIATSAEVDADTRKRTLACGFDEIIEKPIAIDRLLAVVRPYLRRENSSTLLDDNVALQSLGGDRASLHALRNLLAAELDEMQNVYKSTRTIDRKELAARLHRLRASCGFCGATQLGLAAASLQYSLLTSASMAPKAIDEFLELCGATAATLRS